MRCGGTRPEGREAPFPDGSGRASRKTSTDTLTTRQRDSVLGETPIPGASGVRKALEIQDSARARNARIDSIGGS